MEVFFPKPKSRNKLEGKSCAFPFKPLLKVLNHELLVWFFADTSSQLNFCGTRRHKRKNYFQESLQLLVIPIRLQNEGIFDANKSEVLVLTK